MSSGADKDIESFSSKNEMRQQHTCIDFYMIQATTITFISRLLIKIFFTILWYFFLSDN